MIQPAIMPESPYSAVRFLRERGYRLEPRVVRPDGFVTHHAVHSPLSVAGLREFVFGDVLDRQGTIRLAIRQGWCVC